MWRLIRMSNFVPYKPEETVRVEITKREALVIQEIRAYAFGKITIHKANNMIVRVEQNQSKMIDEKEEISLPIVGGS